jgi:hypothetical protein
MKLTSGTFKDIFKKKGSTATGTHALNPHKHWKIVLSIFFVMVACLILFSLFILYEIKNDQIFQVAPAPHTASGGVNKALLDKVTASFDAKTAKEAGIRSNPPTYKDPS